MARGGIASAEMVPLGGATRCARDVDHVRDIGEVQIPTPTSAVAGGCRKLVGLFGPSDALTVSKMNVSTVNGPRSALVSVTPAARGRGHR